MSTTFVNAVYYPSWHVYHDKWPSCLQLEYITHIFYAFIGVNQDGTLRALDEWADYHKKDFDGTGGCLAALTKLKRRHPHVKTVVSVGGGTPSSEFPFLASQERSRATFASQIHRFCEQHSFDGVDIDWEHPKTPEQARDLVKLLQHVRIAMPVGEFLLSATFPASEYYLRNLDFAELGRCVDFLNIMGYDFAGRWSEVSGHHAQLHAPLPSGPIDREPASSVSKGIQCVLDAKFPPQKVLLGVPVYARFFKCATRPGCSFSEGGEMDYCDVPRRWVSNANVDQETVAASIVDIRDDGHGKGFVSMDVPETVAFKASYASANGLGGLFYWTGSGDKQGDVSLVRSGYLELCKSRVG